MGIETLNAIAAIVSLSGAVLASWLMFAPAQKPRTRTRRRRA